MNSFHINESSNLKDFSLQQWLCYCLSLEQGRPNLMFPELPVTHLLAQTVAVQHSLFKVSSWVSGCGDQDRLSAVWSLIAELLFTEQRLMATAQPIILLAQRSLSETYYSPQDSLRIKTDREKEREWKNELCITCKVPHRSREQSTTWSLCIFSGILSTGKVSIHIYPAYTQGLMEYSYMKYLKNAYLETYRAVALWPT